MNNRDIHSMAIREHNSPSQIFRMSQNNHWVSITRLYHSEERFYIHLINFFSD